MHSFNFPIILIDIDRNIKFSALIKPTSSLTRFWIVSSFHRACKIKHFNSLPMLNVADKNRVDSELRSIKIAFYFEKRSAEIWVVTSCTGTDANNY